MIFVDSSAWIALFDQRDGFHSRALQFQAELRRGVHGRLITTDYVLDESVTFLHLHGVQGGESEFRRILSRSESIQVVWTTPDRFWTAWERLEQRSDKRWSFTDCLSFATMEAIGIRDAFAFDSDFRQAGFRLLPEGQDD